MIILRIFHSHDGMASLSILGLPGFRCVVLAPWGHFTDFKGILFVGVHLTDVGGVAIPH